MTHKRLIASILFLSVMLAGCFPKYNVHPTPSEPQKVFYSKGKEVLVSLKTNLVMILSIKSKVKFNQKLEFYVFLKNKSFSPINISTANITATINGKRVGVYTYQQLVDEAQDMRNSSHFSNTLASALNTRAAVESGSYYNPNTGQATRMLLEAESKTQANKIDNRADANLYQIQSTALRKQTVFPGHNYSGKIKLKKIRLRKQSNLLQINVFLDGESHSFRFWLSKA